MADNTPYFEHEPETIFQSSFYAPETTKFGTAVGSPTSFVTLNITPSFEMERNPIEVQGATLPVGMTQGLATSTWEGEGQMCVEELQFLSGIQPTITDHAITGGVISDAPSNPNSFTLYHKGFKASACVVSGFKIEGDTKELKTSVSFVGSAAVKDTASTLSFTPTKPTLFVPYNTSVSFYDSSNQLVSSIDKVNSFTLEVSDIWSPVSYLVNSNQTRQQTVAQQRVSGSFNCVVPYDDDAIGLNLLTNNNTYKVVLSNTTDSKTFSFTFDIMIGGMEAPSDTDNIWTIPINGVIMNKATKAIDFSYSDGTSQGSGT